MERMCYYETLVNQAHWMHGPQCSGGPTLDELKRERETAARRVAIKRAWRRRRFVMPM